MLIWQLNIYVIYFRWNPLIKYIEKFHFLYFYKVILAWGSVVYDDFTSLFIISQIGVACFKEQSNTVTFVLPIRSFNYSYLWSVYTLSSSYRSTGYILSLSCINKQYSTLYLHFFSILKYCFISLIYFAMFPIITPFFHILLQDM